MRWWWRWRWTMRRGRRRGSPAWWSTMRQGASKALLPGKFSNICTVHCDWPHVQVQESSWCLWCNREQDQGVRRAHWLLQCCQDWSCKPRVQHRPDDSSSELVKSRLTSNIFQKKMFFIPIHVKWFKQCTNKQLYQSISASVFKALRLWILPEPPEPSRTLHSLKESWEINVLDGIIMAWHYQLSRQQCRLTICIELVELTNSETAATTPQGGGAIGSGIGSGWRFLVN